MAHKRGLTQKNKIFADAYAGDSNEAAAIAGLSQSYGRKLVQAVTSPTVKPAAIAVQEYIREREGTEVRPGVLSRLQRQLWWSKVVQEEANSLSDRLRASELLGKSEADFVDVVKGADSMLLVLGSPRKQIESTVIEGKESHE